MPIRRMCCWQGCEAIREFLLRANEGGNNLPRKKKPTDFGCDPDGSLIGNFVPSIQYTAPKEVFFAESRQHQC
jgi:hypothetical protein